MWVDIEFGAHVWERDAAKAFAQKLNTMHIWPSTVVIMRDEKGRVISAVGWQVNQDQWDKYKP